VIDESSTERQGMGGQPADFSETVVELPGLELDLAAPTESDHLTDRTPTVGHVGRYALKLRIGEGGLGTVHAAYDPILSRTIAVKTLHFGAAGIDRKTLDALILNEARAAAGLSHPHIVTVFDAGLSDQGVYIAMERLRGRDLRQLLAAGWRPDPQQGALIARRVADALAYAHAKGVVHCDIKPANIFMVGRTVPKVLDFGIARVAHARAVPGFEDLIAGSPHYLAPEQLQGGTIDRRTDVYALGVVLYELLTRRKAFSGATLEEIKNNVLEGRAPPVHALRPTVPLALSRIVERAMAREPEQRHRSARHLSQDLRAWLDSETPQPVPEPAERGTRRMTLAAGALAGLAVAAGAMWFTLHDGPGNAVVAEPLAAASHAAGADLQAGPAGGASSAAMAVAATAAGPAASGNPPAPVAAADANAASAPPRPVLAARAASAVAAGGPRDSSNRRARDNGAAAKPTTSAAAPANPPTAAAATGVVQLAISPWGQVEVDGAPAGVAPPLAKLTLPEGEHVITVRNADFPPHTARVKVGPDHNTVVRHRFGS
jgi:serine/threonine-protein kinase